MPFAQVTVSKKLTEEEKISFGKGLDDCIKQIPGKVQFDSVIIINDGVFTHFTNEDPHIYIELQMMGAAKFEEKEDFVKRVTAFVGKTLGIVPARTTVNIIEVFQWGINGVFRALPIGTLTINAGSQDDVINGLMDKNPEAKAK